MPEQGSNDDDNAVGMKDVSGKTDKEDTKNRINPHEESIFGLAGEFLYWYKTSGAIAIFVPQWE